MLVMTVIHYSSSEVSAHANFGSVSTEAVQQYHTLHWVACMYVYLERRESSDKDSGGAGLTVTATVLRINLIYIL
jgi:hypothetical protein